MDERSGEAAPERTLLTSRKEFLDGFGQVLGLARRELRIFHPDLTELEMNTPVRIEALSRLLRGSRLHRVQIALHDIEYVSKRCPRLIGLLGKFAESLFIYQTQGEAAKAQDCFALADSDHFVRRPVASQPRGVLVLNDPKECQPLRERFTEIWELSVATVSANPAGL